MPISIQPLFRSRQAAFEDEGLLVNQDSVGFTRITDAESASSRPAAVAHPKGSFFYIRGSQRTPATS